MRQQLVKLLSGTRFESVARMTYATLLTRVPPKLLSHDAQKSREYDRLTIEIATRSLSSGGNTVDAGAHCGFILKHLVRQSPAGQHWAFEPLPNLAAQLRRRFPTVHVEQVALSDYCGIGNFRFLPAASAYSSLLPRPHMEVGSVVRQLAVDVRRLDDIIPEDVSIEFIKIDVEGAEAAVLRGAAKLLTSRRPVVVFECDPADLLNCIAILEECDLRVSLLADFLTGRRKSRDELISRSQAQHEYYYAASA